ncbi:hypothetical protein HAX54_011457 [Datura stramonium]|uniref:ATPase AAA-type core domain-containing protein n=1 Tax=Datura stramonium TaxID=4076 RepID=A0ABS8TI26_DATST|nr:hypothetical protein [Datura stramonium]
MTKRYFKLKFQQKESRTHHELHLKYVLDEGKAISVRERQRKLYTNNKGEGGGTGKSSMIAAMVNFLQYDVYDLELTSVKDNTELRKLLIDTTSKSIIVIEDIDCSLDLTVNVENKKKRRRREKIKKKMRKMSSRRR